MREASQTQSPFHLAKMLVIYFLITFNYHVLKDLKDTLVVTAKGSGAEVIPFIKVWFMLPAALGATWLVARLISRFGRPMAAQLIISGLMLFYLLFAFVFYPMNDSLHLHGLADSMAAVLPKGLGGLVNTFRYWLFTLFYLSAELWSTLVVSFIFWTFAHDITDFSSAKDHYPLYLVSGSSSGIVSGAMCRWICTQPHHPNMILGSTAWEQALMLIVLVMAVSTLWLLFLLRKVMQAAEGCPASRKKEKTHITLTSSFASVVKNPQLASIALMVLGYHLTINFIEVIWKDQVRTFYSDPGHYNAYMSTVTGWVGFLSIAVALITPFLIRLLTWKRVVLIAPSLILLTTALFFAGVIRPMEIAPFFGVEPAAIAALLGGVAVISARSVKYTLFDTCKEMAFIPLPASERVKGKAVIDGVGSRFGKSAASFYCQGTLLIFGTIGASAPFIGIPLLLILPGAVFASGYLGKQIEDEPIDSAELVTA